jgi:hypothetical protein
VRDRGGSGQAARRGLTARTGLFDTDSFPGEQLDLAYSCHVWEHLADPVATARAAYDLLADRGGHLVIVVPTFRQAKTLAWACFTAPHTYMFTEVSLGNVLDQAGFDAVGHRFHAGADSELWLVARARPRPVAATTTDPVHEGLASVQRELGRVVLRAPLGVPARAAAHARTLASDPADFARRGWRWARRRGERLGQAAGG